MRVAANRSSSMPASAIFATCCGCFIHGLRTAFADDHAAKAVSAQLDHLKQVLAGNSLDTLRREVVDSLALISRTIELSVLSGQSACLPMVDVDGFKAINDQHGHQASDAVIGAMARLLVRTFPRKTDFVARYAGDEFVVILQDTTAQEGKLLAERLLNRARAVRLPLDQIALQFTVSVGIAGVEADSTAETWLRRADMGLCAAKQAGRDRAVLAGDA